MTPEQKRKAAMIRQRKRRAEDPWGSRASSRRYYHANAEKCRARNKLWRQKNPEKVLAYSRANLERRAAEQRRIRARKKWKSWTKQLASSRNSLAVT